METYKETKFKETEIGKIPFDWKVEEIGEIIKIKHGFAFQGKKFSNKKTKHIVLTPGNVKIQGGFKTEKFKYYIDGSYPKEYIFNEKDMFISMTDLSVSGDTLGAVAIIPKLNGENYLHNQRLGKIVLLNNTIERNFFYEISKIKEFRKQIVNSCSGSTVKHTSPNLIYKTKIPLPTNI